MKFWLKKPCRGDYCTRCYVLPFQVAKKLQTAELLLLEMQSKEAGGAVAADQERDGTAKISKNKVLFH